LDDVGFFAGYTNRGTRGREEAEEEKDEEEKEDLMAFCA